MNQIPPKQDVARRPTITWTHRDTWAMLALAAVVFLSRLPFLNNGYGLDSDSWLTATAAHSIAATGEYVASRLPGHPVQEISYALIAHRGPLAFNLVTTLFSVLAVIMFALAWRVLGSRDYVLAGLAFAFTPIVYVSSTNSMDYIWALAFILASLYFVLSQHTLLAGISLGLAIGCRITSALMLAPLILILAEQGIPGRKSRQTLALVAATCLVGAVTYIPVVLRYGRGFTDVYTSSQSLLFVVKRSTEEIWGLIGLLAIAVAIVLQLVLRRKFSGARSIPRFVGWLSLAAWAMAICLYLATYLRLPHEAGYLIPAIPFVLLLLGRLLDRRLFAATCVALVLSAFFFGLNETGKHNSPQFSALALRLGSPSRQIVLDPLRGPIFIDHSRRQAALAYTAKVIETAKNLPEHSVIAVGEWIDQIRASLPDDYRGDPKYIFNLDDPRLAEYVQEGFTGYYYLTKTAAESMPPELPPGAEAPQPLNISS